MITSKRMHLTSISFFSFDCNLSFLLMYAFISDPHQTLLLPFVYYFLPAEPGVFLLVLLLSVCCCCLLRPATHRPLIFHQDTNLQALLALRSNFSSQGYRLLRLHRGRKVMEITLTTDPKLNIWISYFALHVSLWKNLVLCTKTHRH